MASYGTTYLEVEEAATAIAAVFDSTAFNELAGRVDSTMITMVENERDEWRAVARVAIAIHRAQQV